MKKVIYLAALSTLLLSFTVANGIKKESKPVAQTVVKAVDTPEIQGIFSADRNQFK